MKRGLFCTIGVFSLAWSLAFGLVRCGSGGPSTGSGLDEDGDSALSSVELTDFSAVFISTSTPKSASLSSDIRFSLIDLLLSRRAFAATTSNQLRGLKDGEIASVVFKNEDGSERTPEIDSIRMVGQDYLLIKFSDGKVGLVRVSDGKIKSLSRKIDPNSLYILSVWGMVYIGYSSTIYKFNFEDGSVNAVNDASANPVRLEGPNGDFWVAKDGAGDGYLIGAYVNSGQCASLNFCLFTEDGNALPMETSGVANFWPGRSIIYGDDGKIYQGGVTTSQTGSNWSQSAKTLIFEFSRTPYSDGRRGQVTETTINSASGSGHPYPFDLFARNSELFDYGTKYTVDPLGSYKISPVSGGGAVMTYTPQDLSVMYQAYENNGHGPIAKMYGASPVTGESLVTSALFLYEDVIYYYKNGSISRIPLDGVGGSETLVSDSTIYYYTIADHRLVYFTASGVFSKGISNPSSPPTEVSGEFEMNNLVYLY